MKVTFYHIKDDRNVGDQRCCPALYFDEWKDAEVKSIFDWSPDTDRVSIFGGGGLLYHELHDIFSRAAHCRKRGETGPLIIWGAGENMHNQHALLEPYYLNHFDLVGIRDDNHSFGQFVPCVSCLMKWVWPAIDPIFPVVVYHHHKSPIDLPFAPRLSNSCEDGVSIEDRLAFIAQGKIVVTNSYHGAYWALLMNRRVLLVAGPPNSSRFHHMRWQPPIVAADRIATNLHKAKDFPAALQEATNMNLLFRKEIHTRYGV